MFFIIGNPRSGTSLLRLMLTSNPGIHIPPECGFMMWWANKYGAVNSAEESYDMAAFADDLFTSKKFEFWKLGREEVLAKLNMMADHSYAELCASIYQLHAYKVGKPNAHLGDKNNFHTSHVGELDRYFPNCKFIHIIRDGRDVASSYMALNDTAPASDYYPRLTQDIKAIAHEWTENVSSVHNYLKQLPRSRWAEVRYEDVVTDTKVTLKLLCSLLEVEYNPAMLDYHIANKRDSLEPPEFMAWKSKTLGEVDDSSIGRYKSLDRNKVQAFEAIASGPLSQYGYI